MYVVAGMTTHVLTQHDTIQQHRLAERLCKCGCRSGTWGTTSRCAFLCGNIRSVVPTYIRLHLPPSTPKTHIDTHARPFSSKQTPNTKTNHTKKQTGARSLRPPVVPRYRQPRRPSAPRRHHPLPRLQLPLVRRGNGFFSCIFCIILALSRQKIDSSCVRPNSPSHAKSHPAGFVLLS